MFQKIPPQCVATTHQWNLHYIATIYNISKITTIDHKLYWIKLSYCLQINRLKMRIKAVKTTKKISSIFTQWTINLWIFWCNPQPRIMINRLFIKASPIVQVHRIRIKYDLNSKTLHLFTTILLTKNNKMTPFVLLHREYKSIKKTPL